MNHSFESSLFNEWFIHEANKSESSIELTDSIIWLHRIQKTCYICMDHFYGAFVSFLKLQSLFILIAWKRVTGAVFVISPRVPQKTKSYGLRMTGIINHLWCKLIAIFGWTIPLNVFSLADWIAIFQLITTLKSCAKITGLLQRSTDSHRAKWYGVFLAAFNHEIPLQSKWLPSDRQLTSLRDSS